MREGITVRKIERISSLSLSLSPSEVVMEKSEKS